MSFYAYMLRCSDGSFYVGHTDNLETRFYMHCEGLLPSYTKTRLPVELVWSAEFPTRYEALQTERQIKGWSRAKKAALIRSDWAALSRLARSHGSTSSPRTLGGYAPFVLSLSKDESGTALRP